MGSCAPRLGARDPRTPLRCSRGDPRSSGCKARGAVPSPAPCAGHTPARPAAHTKRRVITVGTDGARSRYFPSPARPAARAPQAHTPSPVISLSISKKYVPTVPEPNSAVPSAVPTVCRACHQHAEPNRPFFRGWAGRWLASSFAVSPTLGSAPRPRDSATRSPSSTQRRGRAPPSRGW